ncbi:MAG: hypothetical protein CVV18_00390 [Gammaproteobacteria bacterium HGW-Gammaproteobacteria-8]|nr:MAG: hypothetical protein CVV18_00390 [Gammaproteobacteria bacterium HGW-Gammaproteobacteria-8]
MSNTRATAKRGAKPLPPAEHVGPAINGKFVEQQHQQLQAMSALQAELHDAAVVTAREIGYEGEISIGSLEDGIRFYQRRTAEACVELGKRLILLKELAPHGEFEDRAEELGFTSRTAQRFMQVAAKVAKSATMSLLAGRAKGINALLELVTYDDDELEVLKDLDDVECMSPSQLRAALRESREQYAARSKVIENNQAELQKAMEKAALIPRMKPDVKLAAMSMECVSAFAPAINATRDVTNCVSALVAYANESGLDIDEKQMTHYTMRLVEPFAVLLSTLKLAGVVGPADAVGVAFGEPKE